MFSITSLLSRSGTGHFHSVAALGTQTLVKNFQRHVFELSVGANNTENCITNCIADVKEAIYSHDYQFSKTGIEKAGLVIEDFKQAVDQFPDLSDDEIKTLNAEFNQVFSKVIKEKWSNESAKSFFTILEISQQEEQILAAQKWTQDCFDGLNKLNEWQPCFSFPNFISQFCQMISSDFRSCALQASEKKMKEMYERMTNDPISFEKTLEKVFEKEKENPSSLSAVEKEYSEFMQSLANSATMYWPDIDKKIDLLKQCIWSGYTLQKMHRSILESNSFFTEIFQKNAQTSE